MSDRVHDDVRALDRATRKLIVASRATLRNDGLPPLRRLRAWVDNQLEYPTRRLEELPSAPDAFDGWLGAIFHPRLPWDQMAYDS